MATNEPIVSYRKVTGSSNRSFGLVFAAVFALIGLAPLYRGGDLRYWALGLGVAFVAAAVFAPKVLEPLNRLWFKLGLLIHHVANPIVMFLLFFGAVLPTALVMRAMGKDPLRLKREPAATSYWIAREPGAPERGSMRKQF
jgi:hypothetical protein